MEVILRLSTSTTIFTVLYAYIPEFSIKGLTIFDTKLFTETPSSLYVSRLLLPQYHRRAKEGE